MFSSSLRGIVLTLCEDLATPRSLAVAILLRNCEFDQLVDLRVDPLHYLERFHEDKFWRDTVCTEFLRKMSDLELTRDLHEGAVKTFFECEHICAKTNLRLQSLIHNEASRPEDELLHAYVSRVKKIVSKILGPLPEDLTPRFGPGATASDPGNLSTVPDKLTSRPTLTRSARHLVIPLWEKTAWARALAIDRPHRSAPSYVRGDRFASVPKDSTKRRGIGIGPSLNVAYQLPVGRFIRQRLRLVGIDLKDGQTLHRRVAREASLSGEYATLDLSNASDTIALNLVRLLLPPEWFELLSDLRSPVVTIGKKVVHLQKFSAMGNGYTFELETLVFLALILALDNRLMAGVNVWVYGDDIIVPSHVSGTVKSTLEYFGFSLNKRKSFSSGGFRESCGGDFFSGVPVRGLYLEETPHEIHEWIALANNLRRVCSDRAGRLKVIRRAWFKCLDQIPAHVRKCRGPSSLGDIVLHDVEETWTTRPRSSIRYLRVYRPKHPKVQWQHWAPEMQWASILYGVDSGNKNSHREDGSSVLAIDSGGVTPRGALPTYKIGWTPFS